MAEGPRLRRRALLAAPAFVAMALLLVASAPRAFAQSVEIEEFPGPIKPISEDVTANVTVEVPCPPPTFTSSAELVVVEAPPWSVLAFGPVSYTFESGECRDGRVVKRGVLHGATTINAPAFEPAAVRVSVHFAMPTGGSRQEATRTIEADFFSVVDVVPERTIWSVAPGREAVIPVLVTNFGNDATRVTFGLVGSAAPGWTVTLPAPVEIGAKAKGGNVSAHVEFRAAYTGDGAYLNEFASFIVHANAFHATRTGLEGDETEVHFTVAARGFAAAGPGAPWLLAVVALAAVAHASLFRRRP